MLFEKDVIDAVCPALESKGYTILQRLNTTQQGDDIIAYKGISGIELHIEAKGATSSRLGSQRYGKPFDTAQVRIHVAEAFYKAAEALSRQSTSVKIRAGIALPDDVGHRAAEHRIEPIIKSLEIVMFWVTPTNQVIIESAWEL